MVFIINKFCYIVLQLSETTKLWYNDRLSMEKIVLILSEIANYRIDFLNQLSDSLEKEGKELIVIRGKNISKKIVNEKIFANFTILTTETKSIKFLNFDLKWQKKIIKQVLTLKPYKVLMLYNAGNLNYNILLLWLKITGIPYLLWGCGWERDDLKGFKFRFKKWVKSFFINWSSGYITYDTSFAKKLIANAYPENHIFVAQNTINIEKIIKNRNPISKEYDTIKFIFVGALIKEKNLEKAINSFYNLHKMGYNFQFTIIGEGEIKNQLINLVDRLNLTHKISILGALYGKQLQQYFEKANVFILPGTGGLAVNEAMAYALPIISTPADGTIFDLVEDNINGFLLKTDYKQVELQEKILFFLNAPLNRITEMEKESLRLIQERAPLSNQVNQFIKAINEY